MKIKFICLEFGNEENCIFNPIYYFLKSFYLKNGRNNDSVQWLKYSFDVHDIKNILGEEPEPDIICFSLYSWNQEESSKIARKLKQFLPKTLFIIGGPQVETNNNVFEKFEWADYAIYGDGEEAFQLLIDGIIDNDLNRCVNLITREKVYPHKIMKFDNFVEYSPYLDLKDELKQDVLSQKQKYSNLKIAYQRVRGCPFKCSFCDWQADLHWKINVRNTDWKAELDFLSDFGCVIRCIDANFGIYDEDIEIIKYALRLYKEKKNGFFFQPINFSKVKKDKVYYMLDMVLDTIKDTDPFHPFVIALQDTNSQVLKNINRPDLEWNEHKKYISNMKKKYKFANIIPEVILGLPGFDLENYKNQLLEFASLQMSPIHSHNWVLLTNSPSAKKEYIEKFDLEIHEGYQIYKELPKNMSINELLKSEDKEKYIFREDYIIPNGELRNILKAKVYNNIFNYCSNYMWRSILVGKNKSINEKTSYNFTKMIFEKLEKEIEYLSDNMYHNITKRIDETGFFIYCHEHEGNVVSTRNFLITEVKKMLLRNNLNQFKDVIGWNITVWDYKFKNENKNNLY